MEGIGGDALQGDEGLDKLFFFVLDNHWQFQWVPGSLFFKVPILSLDDGLKPRRALSCYH